MTHATSRTWIPRLRTAVLHQPKCDALAFRSPHLVLPILGRWPSKIELLSVRLPNVFSGGCVHPSSLQRSVELHIVLPRDVLSEGPWWWYHDQGMLHLDVNSFACAPPSSLTKDFTSSLPMSYCCWYACCAGCLGHYSSRAWKIQSTFRIWQTEHMQNPRSSLPCSSLEADEANKADSDSECISSDIWPPRCATVVLKRGRGGQNSHGCANNGKSWQAKTQTCPQRQCVLTCFKTLCQRRHERSWKKTRKI